MIKRGRLIALVLTTSLVLAGCGRNAVVTYNDPNAEGVAATSADAAPIERYGADTIERAVALARLRAHAHVIRALARSDGDPAAIATEAGNISGTDASAVVGAIALRDPDRAARTDASLQQLVAEADSAGTRALTSGLRARLATHAAEVDRQLMAARQAAVGNEPLASDRWHAAYVATLVMDELAAAYESAYVDGLSAGTADSSYRTAWGLMQVITDTSTLRGLAPSNRELARRMLTSAGRRLMPDIVAPAAPEDAEEATSSISEIADALSGAAQVDTTLPPPTSSTESALRRVRSELDLARAAHVARDAARMQEHLRLAATAHAMAAPGIAGVDAVALGNIDFALGVLVPSLTSGSPLRAAADKTPADQRFDSAIDAVDAALESVHEELKVLSEDG